MVGMHWKSACVEKRGLKQTVFKGEICKNDMFQVCFYMVGIHWNPICVHKKLCSKQPVLKGKYAKMAFCKHVLYARNALKTGLGR